MDTDVNELNCDVAYIAFTPASVFLHCWFPPASSGKVSLNLAGISFFIPVAIRYLWRISVARRFFHGSQMIEAAS
jgi:hypothetical protein